MAWACAEALLQQNRALTLFATHYFELTQSIAQLPGCKNVHVEASEHDDTIVFEHRVSEGAANRSFGVQVAQLAGLPRPVLQRAKQVLHELEQAPEQAQSKQQVLSLETQTAPPAPVEHPMVKELETLEVNGMTPLEALQWLARWQQQLSRTGTKRRD